MEWDVAFPRWKVEKAMDTYGPGVLYEMERGDDFGCVTRNTLRVIGFQGEADPQQLRAQVEQMLARIEKAEALERYPQIMGYEDHWVSGTEGDWKVCLQSTHLPTLRQYCDSLRDRSEPVVRLSADPRKAKEELRRMRQKEKLPLETVLAIAYILCFALERCSEKGLGDCAVDMDSVYVGAQNKFMLGDLACLPEGRPVGTVGIGILMHALLMEEDGALRGSKRLRDLVSRAREGEFTPTRLREALDALEQGRPEPAEKRKPESAAEEKKQPEKVPPVSANKTANGEAAQTHKEPQRPEAEKKKEKEPERKKPPVEPQGTQFVVAGDLLGGGTAPKPVQLSLKDEIRRRVIRSGTLAAGAYHTVGLTDMGRVLATGLNRHKQCQVMSWKNMASVAAGDHHTVGLHSDGTAVAVGENEDGQCNVKDWKNLIQICAGEEHTVGLCEDGRVRTAGNNSFGQCEVSLWRNIAAVSASMKHTIGLREDGTVVVAGEALSGQNAVLKWKDLVQIDSGAFHTLGLRKDGTVVSAGGEVYGRLEVSSWRNIVAVAVGRNHAAGLRKDGTVVAVSDGSRASMHGQCLVGEWTDIVAVACGNFHTLGLRRDGTVLAIGGNFNSECNVKSFKGICVPNLPDGI